MRHSINKYLFAVVVIIASLLIAKFGMWRWTISHFSELQSDQLATIDQLGQFPPAGVEPQQWESSLGTLHNVWANVFCYPEYSGLSSAQMQSLQMKLDEILAETTQDNSIESVDRVFELMLQNSPRKEFISRYREGFQYYRKVAL